MLSGWVHQSSGVYQCVGKSRTNRIYIKKNYGAGLSLRALRFSIWCKCALNLFKITAVIQADNVRNVRCFGCCTVQLGVPVSTPYDLCLYQISCARHLIKQNWRFFPHVLERSKRCFDFVIYFLHICIIVSIVSCHFDYSTYSTNFLVHQNGNVTLSFINQTKNTLSKLLSNPFLHAGKWERAPLSLPMSTWVL